MKKPLSWIEINLTVSPELCEECGAIIFEEAGQGSFTEEMLDQDQCPSQIKAYLPRDESFRKNLIGLRKRIATLYSYFPDFPPPGLGPSPDL